MKHLLVFGTFNPITNAHIGLIETAKKHIGKNTRVTLIPSNLHFMEDWKTVDKDFITDEERIGLLERVARSKGYEVSLVEAEGKVDGKTYNTVLALNIPKDEKIFFCYGDDKIKEFPQWYKAEELFGDERHVFLIANRLLKRTKPLVKFLTDQKLVKNFKVFTLDNSFRTVSSTAVRTAYRNNDMEYIKENTPEEVFTFLQERKKNLYFFEKERKEK